MGVMCKPPPGLPCAAHARPRRDRARRAYIAAKARAAQKEDALRGILAADEGTYDEVGGEHPAVAAARADAWSALSAAQTARAEYVDAQAMFDLTPRGLDELAAAVTTAAGTPQHAAITVRYELAQTRAKDRQQQWRASSAYTVEQINTARDTARLPALLAELSDRRCVEQHVPPPPTDQRAVPAWQAVDPHGRVYTALTARGVPAEQASCTFMLPALVTALTAAAGKPTQDPLLAAHWAAMPSRMLTDDNLEAATHRAYTTGQPATRTLSEAINAALSRGRRLLDATGAAAVDAEPGDEWAAVPVGGPLRLRGLDTDVQVDSGWVCVRVRDELLRALPDLSRFNPE